MQHTHTHVQSLFIVFALSCDCHVQWLGQKSFSSLLNNNHLIIVNSLNRISIDRKCDVDRERWELLWWASAVSVCFFCFHFIFIWFYVWLIHIFHLCVVDACDCCSSHILALPIHWIEVLYEIAILMFNITPTNYDCPFLSAYTTHDVLWIPFFRRQCVALIIRRTFVCCCCCYSNFHPIEIHGEQNSIGTWIILTIDSKWIDTHWYVHNEID